MHFYGPSYLLYFRFSVQLHYLQAYLLEPLWYLNFSYFKYIRCIHVANIVRIQLLASFKQSMTWHPCFVSNFSLGATIMLLIPWGFGTRFCILCFTSGGLTL